MEHTLHNAEAIKARLFSLNSKGIKYDLDRMFGAASHCGNPQTHYKCFHVAGTNGKGSVCTCIESALRGFGLRTALFLSPHLVDFEERFLINGCPVSENQWLEVYYDLEPVIQEFQLTFFEATTLMAFELFRRERVDWAVFEVGLGGRFDATNLVTPQVSVITSIAMDHMEYLGDTLLKIAGEKLGIIKSGVPLVITEPPQQEIRDLIDEKCKAKGTPYTIVKASAARQIASTRKDVSFEWRDTRWELALAGGYQVQNALTAITALEKAGFDDLDAIKNSLKTVCLPGRFQVMTLSGKTVVFDVGHNPNAASILVDGLQKQFSGKKFCIVTGIMRDKDIAGVLRQYSSIATRLILTRPDTPRAASIEELKAAVPVTFKGLIQTTDAVRHAVEAAIEGAEEVVCITGSFFTVGEAMTAVGIKPYSKNLRAF